MPAQIWRISVPMSTVNLNNLSAPTIRSARSEEHTSELQSLAYLVCRLLLEKKKKKLSIQSEQPTYHPQKLNHPFLCTAHDYKRNLCNQIPPPYKASMLSMCSDETSNRLLRPSSCISHLLHLLYLFHNSSYHSTLRT